LAVDIYKQALPRPKGVSNYISNAGANSIQSNPLLSKIKQRKYQESTSKQYSHSFQNVELKLAGAASLQRDSNCNSELGLLINGSF